MRKNFYRVVIALIIGMLAISACSSTATVPEVEQEVQAEEQMPEQEVQAEEQMPEAEAEPEQPGLEALSGNITLAGSSTVYPLAEAMTDRFSAEGFSGEVTISSVGSGAGFERFCVAGETDIANASRAIKDSEVESCQAIGRTPIEFRVGTDAIAIVVSTENTFLTDVTLEELGMIFSARTTKWSDVRAEWPNENILRFSPGTDSGTFDYFVEGVMAPLNPNAEGKADMDAGKLDILNAENTQFSEDDNVLVLGVKGSQYAIGYFGFAYYLENQDSLIALSIDGISPTAESAEDGSYALARPLFIYSDAKILKDKPQVAAFVDFFLTYVNDEIETVGYFPASDEALNAARQAFSDAVK